MEPISIAVTVKWPLKKMLQGILWVLGVLGYELRKRAPLQAPPRIERVEAFRGQPARLVVHNSGGSADFRADCRILSVCGEPPTTKEHPFSAAWLSGLINKERIGGDSYGEIALAQSSPLGRQNTRGMLEVLEGTEWAIYPGGPKPFLRLGWDYGSEPVPRITIFVEIKASPALADPWKGVFEIEPDEWGRWVNIKRIDIAG